MNEEALKDAYSLFVNTGYNKSFDDFKNLISTNPDALKDAYSLFVNTGYNKSIDDFSTLMGVKKKDATAISAGSTSASTSPQVSSSVSSSSQSTQPSPDMQQSAERFMPQQQEQAQPIQPQPINKQSPQMEQFISEQLLPKEQQGTYYQKPAAVVQQPQNIKEFSQKYFTPEIPKEQYIKTVSIPVYDYEGEKTFFTRDMADQIADPNESPIANKFLRGIAYFNETTQTNPMSGAPYQIMDFIDDMARDVASGSRDAAAATPNFNALMNYSKMSDGDIKTFINVNKNMEEAPPSKEMEDFMKSTDEDPSIFNLFKQFALNPTGAIGVGFRSMRAMINPASMAAAGTVVGTSAAGGALVGSAVPLAGTAAGAASAATASLPYAMGVASGTLDASLSFGQYVKEALGDKPFTEENVKKLFQDTEKMESIRNKALARGFTVGIFDAFTMKLGGSVGAKMLAKNAANKIGAVAAGTAIESIGGATGEAAAQVVSGEKINVRDIFLEGIAEMPMGAVSVFSEATSLPKYHVNGERVSYNTLNNIVETATGDELQKMDIQVSKDQTGIEKKINDKVVTSQIREEVRNSDPNLTDAQVEGITLLEKELRDNQGNTTSVGKEKVQQIKNKINEIKNNKDYAIQEPEAEGSMLRPEQPEVGLQEVGKGDTQGKEAPGPTTQEQVIITDEDKARRQSLTDALFIAEELGDDKVMVGDTEMSLQDAKQELADLTLKEEKSKQAPAPAPTAEVAAPAAPIAEQVAPAAPVAEKQNLMSQRNTDLFPDAINFAQEDNNSKLSDYAEANGIGVATYTNPENGLVDTIMTGTSDNDFVGFIRIYENGKPTNKFSSKMSNESGNKENFKTMLSEAQKRLPEGHLYTEKTSVSIDGIRVFSNQLNRGYEVATDENGNPITQDVTLNNASVEGLRNARNQNQKEALYNNKFVKTQEEFDQIKAKILELMPQAKVTFNKPIGRVTISLPVLKSTTTQAAPAVTATEQVAPTAEPTTDIETKKADIKRREQEELKQFGTSEKETPKNNIKVLGVNEYVTRELMELAYSNDSGNNPKIGGGGQTLDRIIERGGYSKSELFNLLKPEIDKIKAKYKAELAALESTTTQAAPAVTTTEQVAPTATEQVAPEFQLESKTSTANQEMIDEATRLMEEQEKKGFSENVFDATSPEPSVKPITIVVKENSALAKKVKRMGLSQLIGKKINLVMADQLKVGNISIGKKMLNRMGGPFFPLIDKLFGKVAWASINKSAAMSIVNGAINSDYTVVYNMNPSAIDSNSALRETFIETIKLMPKAERDIILSQMLDQINGKRFGDKTDAVRFELSKVKTFEQFAKAISKFDVDTKAAIMNSILPSRDVNAKTNIGKTLQDKGITIESLREQNIEQFVADLPSGALTMVLEVNDKNGNKVTNATKSEAIMTRDQQIAEGLPIHDNYPIYIRGKAIALLEETVPFYNLLKDSMDNINAKVANIIKKASGVSVTSREARENEIRRASMSANRARQVTSPMVSEYEKFIALLSRSFPTIEIITSQKEFDNLLKNLNAKELVTKTQKIYGAVLNGKIYLNPSLENYNTPIHEFGHIWTNIVEQIKPELFNKGISLIENSEYVKRVTDNADYNRIIDKMRKEGASEQEIQAYINKEALATAIGDRGESFVIAAQKKDFKNWLNKLYSLVKNLTGISKYTAEQLQNITLEEFTKAVSIDLLSGTELFTNLQAEKLSEQLQLSTENQTPDDIVKRGRANGVSEEAIRKVLENKGIETADIDKALGKVAPAGTKVELSEETLPGYNKLVNRIKGIIERGRKKGYSDQKIRDNVVKNVQANDPAYAAATNVQQEQIIRDIDKQLGQRQKSAPSKEKVLGKEKKMVTVDDAAALADQIRLEARAAREAKMDLNKWRDLIGKYIGQMQTIGKITTAQAQAIVRKISKLNVDNLAHVEKFIQYMEKVFADAEYDTKLQLARKNIKKLKDLANNKKKDVNLTTLAKEFLRVDPSLVEDIDRYNAIAASIIESLQGSKITNKKEAEIEFARMVSQVGVMDYVNREVALQQELQRKIADKIAQEQFGVEEGDLTYDQIQELLAEDNTEAVKKYDNIIRAKLKDMFDGLSAVIKSMIEQQEDPFTYERTTFTDSEKKTINNFMSMDINKLSLKEALRAVDALHNFIVNRSTASMGAIYANYIGNKNISQLIADKVRAKALKLFGSEFAGELMTGSTAQISMVFERLFKSANIGRRVQKMSGLTDAINGFSKAETDTNNIVNEYVDTFYKRKANGEEFNTAFNDTERGMVAFMSRTVFGTKAMIQDVFNARKKIIEDSIKELSKGTSKEARVAELYQKVYDKILADSNNSQEVRDKADPTNIEAVNFWVSQWDSKFDALADISERIYNTILEKFAYYTPDRYSKLVLGGVKETTEEDILASSFINKNGGSITKEAKSLMAAKKQPALPKGRYINLSFDSVNSDAMRDVLVDENTAAPIRQILAFIDSPKLIELIPNNDDRVLLISRIKLYLQTEKNAIFVENTEVEKAAKIFSKFLNFGASLVLSSLRQAPQQVIPVLVDTFINTGKINFYDYFNVNKYNLMKNSGHSIANRLNMSATDVKRINELLDYAASSKLEKSLEAIAKVNDIYLKAFLAKPDAFAAQSSWILYYEKSLKKQGVPNMRTINFNGREREEVMSMKNYWEYPLNEEAADYASFMVDRTQNPSNQAQKGRIFTYKDAGKNAFMRVLFTLASFRMNTTNRIHSDIIALTSKTATFEDRRTHAASLAGAVSGSIIFVALSSYIAYLSKLIIRKLMGRDDDEEEKDKILKKTLKGGTTRLASDILSPVPILDSYINKGINYAYEKYKLNQGVDPKEIESPLYDFEDSKTFGIAGEIYDRAGQLIDVINMVESGEYVDKYGQTHKVTEEDREYLKKYVITPAVLNIPGLLPGESEAFVRGSIKVAQGGEKEEKEKRKAAIEPPIPAPFKTWSEVERNEPQLYKKLMGPGSPGYKEREAEKKAKRLEREAKEAARDIELGYQPKPKGRSGGGFGNWGGSFNENRNKSNNKFGWDNK